MNSIMNESLRELLSTFGSIYFYPMWGNNGDDLIKMGALKMFDELGLSLSKNPESAEAIVVNGGGAMTDAWGGLPYLRDIISTFKKPKIVLPSSFDFNKESPAFSDDLEMDDLYLFCREGLSYKKLRGVYGCSDRVRLGHDMALSLTPDFFLNDESIQYGRKPDVLIVERRDAESATGVAGQSAYRVPLKKYVPMPLKRPIKRWLEASIYKSETSFEKICKDIYRKECGRDDFDHLSLDVSSKSLCSFNQFLRLVYGAKFVFTTRLHVAILRHIFQKRCFLLPTNGSYQKNERVFYHSLAQDGWVSLLECKEP